MNNKGLTAEELNDFEKFIEHLIKISTSRKPPNTWDRKDFAAYLNVYNELIASRKRRVQAEEKRIDEMVLFMEKHHR